MSNYVRKNSSRTTRKTFWTWDNLPLRTKGSSKDAPEKLTKLQKNLINLKKKMNKKCMNNILKKEMKRKMQVPSKIIQSCFFFCCCWWEFSISQGIKKLHRSAWRNSHSTTATQTILLAIFAINSMIAYSRNAEEMLKNHTTKMKKIHRRGRSKTTAGWRRFVSQLLSVLSVHTLQDLTTWEDFSTFCS